MSVQPCAAGKACLEYSQLTLEPRWATQGPLCDRCLEASETAVGSLELDYLDLDGLDQAKAASTDFVTGSRSSQVPINLEADALQRQLVHVSTTWEEILRSELGDSLEPASVRHLTALRASQSYLQPRVVYLARVEPVEVYPTGCEDEIAEMSGWQALLLIRKLHNRTKKLVGLTEWIDHLPGLCDGCGCDTLRRSSGADYVYCARCPSWKTYENYLKAIRLDV